MNTQEVAKKWQKMCQEGKGLEFIQESYADNIVSREMPGTPFDEVISGKEKVLAKSKQWLDDVIEVHKSEVSDPVIAGNHFSSKMNFDITFKSSGRQKMEEICVFEVQNGKIVNEQFFYSM